MGSRRSAPRLLLSAGLMVATFMIPGPGVAEAAPILFTASGDSASLQPTVDAFRAILGDPNNGNNAGPLADGRREINWDGGGTVVTTATGTPLNQFLTTRGVQFTTPGTGFLQVMPDNLDTEFSNFTYDDFTAFSPLRVFTPIDSNITDVRFFVPGTTDPATVEGFGTIFSDVDLTNQTSLQFFDESDVSLGIFYAPIGSLPSGSLSFLGVFFDAGEQIFRVRITTGNLALGPTAIDGFPGDLVVMDDVIFSEPQALGDGGPTPIPEPASMTMLGMGLLGAAAARKYRRRRQH